MGYLYRPKLRSGKPGRIWWVKYYVNGRPVRESTGTEKETEAKRFLKARGGREAMGQPVLRRAGAPGAAGPARPRSDGHVCGHVGPDGG